MRTNSSVNSPQIKSIAVLPLTNLTGDPQQEYFADGMTEALIADLAKVKALKVISRTSVMQYKERKKTIPEIARELKVDAIVAGSVVRSGDRVRITAQLILAKTDTHLWVETYERDIGDVLSLQKEIARSIVQEIKINVHPQEMAALKKEQKITPEAYEAFLKGQFFFWKDWEKAIKYYQEAIDKEPSFALAHTYLASIYAESAGYTLPLPEGLRKARSTIQKALEIDNSLAIAHAVSGDIYSYEWKWSEAEKEMKRAIELDPKCWDCYFSYAAYYKHLARFDDAIAMNKKAMELDPLNRPLVKHIGYLFLSVGRYEEMDAACRTAQELSSDYFECWWQVIANTLQGNYAKAIAQMESFTGSKDNPVDTGWVYGMAGQEKKALASLNTLMDWSKESYVDPLQIATVYAGMGEKDKAFEWLEKAYKAHCHSLGDVKADPRLQPLHSDPRLWDLVRRIGIPD
jgi:TolB-like protein